jgi:nicotinamidase-related amidase
MPHSSPDLHGNAPDRCEVALLLIDVINDFEFETGKQLYPAAFKAARELQQLKRRARTASVPCIYVNDNYGRWRSDFKMQVRHCLEDKTRGAPIVQLLLPDEDDYFVLKPKHSAFYQTCLAVLLDHLHTRQLVIGGFTTESCVTFSATDAYLRGYELIVASDGCAANDPKGHRGALTQMQRTLHARTPKCSEIQFARSKQGTRLRLRSEH